MLANMKVSNEVGLTSNDIRDLCLLRELRKLRALDDVTEAQTPEPEQLDPYAHRPRPLYNPPNPNPTTTSASQQQQQQEEQQQQQQQQQSCQYKALNRTKYTRFIQEEHVEYREDRTKKVSKVAVAVADEHADEITLTDEWLILRTNITNRKYASRRHKTYAVMAMDLLERTLLYLFGATHLSKLLECEATVTFIESLSTALRKGLGDRKWTDGTRTQVMITMRSVLREFGFPATSMRAFYLETKSQSWDPLLGKKYGTRDPNDPARRRLELWIGIVRNVSQNQSAVSIKTLFGFLLGPVMRALAVDLDTWPETAERAIALVDNAVQQNHLVLAVCTTMPKLHWMQLFLTHIVGSTYVIPAPLKKRIGRAARHARPPDEDEDKHRISKEDLEKLHAAAIQDSFQELFFMTLLTTGMRIGAYSRLRCLDIAEIENERWRVRSEGKVIEKGGKPWRFRIATRVNELMTEWLNVHRPVSSSPWVFPSRISGQHLKTHTFRQQFVAIYKRAGLQGRQFHPHSLRHCFSYIMVALGNSMELVAKLINHSDAKTTQKFYVRESATELVNRAKIPWMEHHNESEEERQRRIDPLPDFLKKLSQASPSSHPLLRKLCQLTSPPSASPSASALSTSLSLSPSSSSISASSSSTSHTSPYPSLPPHTSSSLPLENAENPAKRARHDNGDGGGDGDGDKHGHGHGHGCADKDKRLWRKYSRDIPPELFYK